MDTPPSPTMIWPYINYTDAHAAMRFLTDAFGFVATEVVEDDSSGEGPDWPVVHAEMRWPEGGGLMLGSNSGEGHEMERTPGASSIYVVTADPDGLFARATGAGAQVVREIHDEDYGSRGFTVTDPEGNLWSFGTYAGV